MKEKKLDQERERERDVPVHDKSGRQGQGVCESRRRPAPPATTSGTVCDFSPALPPTLHLGPGRPLSTPPPHPTPFPTDPHPPWSTPPPTPPHQPGSGSPAGPYDDAAPNAFLTARSSRRRELVLLAKEALPDTAANGFPTASSVTRLTTLATIDTCSR